MKNENGLLEFLERFKRKDTKGRWQWDGAGLMDLIHHEWHGLCQGEKPAGCSEATIWLTPTGEAVREFLREKKLRENS